MPGRHGAAQGAAQEALRQGAEAGGGPGHGGLRAFQELRLHPGQLALQEILRQLAGRQRRELDRRRRRHRHHALRRGQVAHGGDRRDAGDGVMGERPTERHRAGQPAVEEDRAAAHAGGDAAALQPLAGQPRQDVARLRAEIAHDAHHLDLEALRLAAREDRQAVALLAGLDLVDADGRELARPAGGWASGLVDPEAPEEPERMEEAQVWRRPDRRQSRARRGRREQ